MRTSRIKAKLARGEPVLVTTLHFTDPSLYEMTSLMGFDGIWMDLEHHTYSVETAAGLMRAARVGSSDIIARPAKGEFMRMQRLLEAGAQGIMYPRCEDEQEAAEVVAWAKFAPLGRRGCDSANPDAPYLAMPLEQYVRAANEQTFIIIQLETPSALERADRIAAVDGVDILMLGPGDLSVFIGRPGQLEDERIAEAKRHVAEAAKGAGKHFGWPVASPQQARELLELGGRFVCYGCDFVIVKTGLERVQAEMGPLGFTFENRLRSLGQ
jgi:4-hydroxy-2-oxoheptanedioate aldolase